MLSKNIYMYHSRAPEIKSGFCCSPYSSYSVLVRVDYCLLWSLLFFEHLLAFNIDFEPRLAIFYLSLGNTLLCFQTAFYTIYHLSNVKCHRFSFVEQYSVIYMITFALGGMIYISIYYAQYYVSALFTTPSYRWESTIYCHVENTCNTKVISKRDEVWDYNHFNSVCFYLSCCTNQGTEWSCTGIGVLGSYIFSLFLQFWKL